VVDRSALRERLVRLLDYGVGAQLSAPKPRNGRTPASVAP
jgi:hypothetical protein